MLNSHKGNDSLTRLTTPLLSPGQDQMRVIKQRLLEMVPDLRVFLDVDDLQGALRPHIEPYP